MITAIRGARVLTMSTGRVKHSFAARRGKEMSQLGVREPCDVVIDDGVIREVTAAGDAASSADTNIFAEGRVLMPGFVDCHTHACFAGASARVDEWERKLRGASYLELLRGGGGIMSTVRQTRDERESLLRDATVARVMQAATCGVTTIEIKSGYGLSTEHELKMLRVIHEAALWAAARGITVCATALLGHALDPDVPAAEFVERTISETLPAVHSEFPGVAVDAYCEAGAWSVDQCVRLLGAAAALGHPARVHADQFNSLGMVREAARLGYRSVDHLEAATREDLALLARSNTFGVMLPCCGFHLDGRYADGRGFVDAGGALSLATNHNPGSAPCLNPAMAIALAVRNCGLTVPEAITACTVNGAAVLGLNDRGVIEPGMRADLLLLETDDERTLGYSFGASAARVVIAGGRVVHWGGIR